jgi:hypothetical protein
MATMDRVVPVTLRVFAWLLATSILACSGCQDVVWNEYVGQSDEQIVRRLGPPTGDVPYREGLGRRPTSETLPADSRTLIYEHRHGGRLYIILKPDDGGWRCYESGWVRGDMIID